MDFLGPMTIYDFFPSALSAADFLEPIFEADAAFEPSIYIIKIMMTNVTSLNLNFFFY